MVARVLRIVRVYSQLTTLQAEFLLYLPEVLSLSCSPCHEFGHSINFGRCHISVH